MSDPIVVSYGGGTNSTAMLLGMYERGLRPALTMFADTGDEKPETYTHLESVQRWINFVGFPPIVVVKAAGPKATQDGSLSATCLRLGTMPSKVFGLSSCSMRWKVEPQQRHLKMWMRATGVEHVEHWIGYDADELHRSEKPKPINPFETNRYPLIEWGWGREECVEAITRHGMKQPGKSACFMCPSSKKHEVIWLRDNHPDLYARAIHMESRALAGEGQAPAAQVAGLGRHWNWRTFAGSDVATPEVDCGCYDGESV
jgi:hypothetical protein